jgi:hypothetical protein
MDERQETPKDSTLQLLEQRVDFLQRKVSELQDQQKEIETQINHYRSLLRQYRAVYEAESLGLGPRPPTPVSTKTEVDEAVSLPAATKSGRELTVTPTGIPLRSVFKAVLVIMTESKGQSFHGSQVHERVAERYPHLKENTKAKNLYTAVVAALNRGARQGLYERLEPNVYRMKPREE